MRTVAEAEESESAVATTAPSRTEPNFIDPPPVYLSLVIVLLGNWTAVREDPRLNYPLCSCFYSFRIHRSAGTVGLKAVVLVRRRYPAASSLLGASLHLD